MEFEPTHGREKPVMLGLRATARIHEIDRRLRTINFVRMFARWILLPVLLGATLFVVYRLIARSAWTDPDVLLPLTIGLSALALALSASGRLRNEEEKLRRQRVELALGTPSALPFHLRDPGADSS